MIEEPDIDVQEYIFSFENIDWIYQEEWDEIFLEISDIWMSFQKTRALKSSVNWMLFGGIQILGNTHNFSISVKHWLY